MVPSKYDDRDSFLGLQLAGRGSSSESDKMFLLCLMQSNETSSQNFIITSSVIPSLKASVVSKTHEIIIYKYYKIFATFDNKCQN